MGVAVTPVSWESCGSMLRASSCVVRWRSSHGTVRMKTLPCVTEGLPTLAKIRSNSGYWAPMASICRAYRFVKSSVAPSGPLICASTTPRSSMGDSSLFRPLSTVHDMTPQPMASSTTSQRTRSVQPSRRP